ncbi:MAG: hypothetical protein K0U47_12645 [Epsilonproteobacteria bacterium]|nr:hypothetical protein [Campylobacterota bacterium]
MTTMYIGQIKVAKRAERKQKDGTTAYFSQVTAMFETIDANGEKELSMENVQLPITDLDILKASVEKYIAIPYTTINTSKGTYTFPDDQLLYRVYEHDPLVQIDKGAKKAS